MQIAAMDKDVLSDGSGKAKITWLSLQLIDRRNMTGANWSVSSVRSWLESDILPALPEAVRENIKEVDKTYHTKYAGSTLTSADSIWIPSMYELGQSGSVAESSGVRYSELFPDPKNTLLSKVWDGQSTEWWLRSRGDGDKYYFVSSLSSVNGTTNPAGVVFGFCT